MFQNLTRVVVLHILIVYNSLLLSQIQIQMVRIYVSHLFPMASLLESLWSIQMIL